MNEPNKNKKPLFECLECGKKFYTVQAAERAAFGDHGCPGCGGSDIDAYYPPQLGGCGPSPAQRFHKGL